ncbi:MAG: lipoprotein-releasing ABC transporter permease subunit [Candidatus Omnitrophota bacterium]
MWTFFLSLKYFLSRRREGLISLISLISVLGVALGVASLIIVLSVMNGFDREIRDKIVGTYAHLMVFRDEGIAGYPELVSRLESLPEVKSAAGFVTGQAILKKEKTVTGILLKGIDASKESEVTSVVRYMEKDSGRELEGNTIILGSELMDNEDIAPGDEIEIIVPYSETDLERSKFKVIGSFTSGRYDYDANLAVIDLGRARELFRMKDKVTGIGLRVDDEMNVSKLKFMLQSMLGYPYIVKSWMDLDRNLVSALALEKKMMFIILTLIVMVACFNISSSLIMMVMEKTRDIGILRAIGATSLGVSAVFFLEGALIGLIGILTGGAAGVFIAYRVNAVADLMKRLTGVEIFPSDVYYFTRIPVNVSPADVWFVISVAMLLTLAAGIYPAWKASRLDPVEAIRYE